MTKWNEYNSKYIDGKCFVPVTFPYNKPDGILLENLKLGDLIDYIQKNQIKKAYLFQIVDYGFLKECPDLEHIAIEFSLPFSEYSNCAKKGSKIVMQYDLSPLYSLSKLKTLSAWENEEPFMQTNISIDVSRLVNLQSLTSDYSYLYNLEKMKGLKLLNLYHYSKENLLDLPLIGELETFKLTFSKLQDFTGIEKAESLQCLYLHHNRLLKDISSLKSLKRSLKALRIENCPKIEDFSVLAELENLELLEICGNNTLPSLSFIKSMKNLKTFVFNVNVEDGDLSHCLDLSYVYSEKNRKHYNLKDKDLPKGTYVRGNENIEEWRRLE